MVHQNRIIWQQKHGGRRINPSRESQADLVSTLPRWRPAVEQALVPRREQGLCGHHQQVWMDAHRTWAERQLPLSRAFVAGENQPLSSCLPRPPLVAIGKELGHPKELDPKALDHYPHPANRNLGFQGGTHGRPAVDS